MCDGEEVSVEFRLSTVSNLSVRPASRLPVARWESATAGRVPLVDLVVMGISLRIGLVLTDGSPSGRWPAALAGITAVVLLGSLVCIAYAYSYFPGSGGDRSFIVGL